jgi:carboxynorspermidine decarboxylase
MENFALSDQTITTPAVLFDQTRFVDNLQALAQLRTLSGCKVLYSIKALPLSTLLATALPWVDGFSVSSLFEAQLAAEIATQNVSIHLATPGLRYGELTQLAACCSHLSVNSLNQYMRFYDAFKTHPAMSIGLRVNPALSLVDDARYNPCRTHSKLGTNLAELLAHPLLTTLHGLHVHNNFSGLHAAPLVATLDALSPLLARTINLQWLNLGGGYLYTQWSNADKQLFAARVQQLQQTQPLSLYIEPGKALLEQVACLVSTVIDVFNSDGKSIAILDTSVNHLPEVFEYQQQPAVYQALSREAKGYAVILAGSTCLAGDIFGEYRFVQPLQLGDRIVLPNIGAYSLVKANRFNGYNLPNLYRYSANSGCTLLKHYDYADYRRQWWV